MVLIPHRFLNRSINLEAQTVIIGTFNPEAQKNPATFFFSRGKNYLWKLLPTAFGEDDLRGATDTDKINFINKHKIDFIDLISEIDVGRGNETNYADEYIDSKVTQWRNVVLELSRLSELRRVCFTRKTFDKIPRVKERISEIKDYCDKKKIVFKYMTTPARFYSAAKQAEWNDLFPSRLV